MNAVQGTAPGSTTDSAPPARGSRPTAALRAASCWAGRHPLIVVALATGCIAAGHAVWVWNHRYVGGLDPDEAGYLANALRYQRNLGFDPFPFVRAVGGTGTGPLVPALSVPLLIAGPRDPRVAMLIQPVLMVVLSLGVAATTRRLASGWHAIAAGVTTALMLTVALATQSYWLGLGAAASASVATAALLWSERLSNRWTWVYAVAVACTVLSRTMAMAYVPALALAGAVVAGRDVHRWKRLAGAGLVAAALFGPWLLVNRDGIFGYLFSYGFGERAARFGSGGVWQRLDFRVDRLLEGTGWPGPVLLLAGAAAAAGIVAVAVRVRRGERPESLRLAAALLVATAVSMALLVSTTNNGVWFELPVLAFVVPLAWAAISRAPTPAPSIVGVLVLLAGASLLPDLWWIREFRPGESPTSHYEYGFAQYDERFDPTTRHQHREASDEWAEVSRAVADWMAAQGSERHRPVFTLSGNMQLFNSNTLLLAAELRSTALHIEIPDTGEPLEVQRGWLRPTVERRGVGPVERILLVARHQKTLFTPDLDVAAFEELARSTGWEHVRSFELPTDGEVAVFAHRSSR